MSSRVNWKYFLLVVPTIIYVLALSIYPALSVVYESFKTPSGHYTVSNYTALGYYGLQSALVDTLIVSIAALVLQLFLALFIAMIMMKPFKGSKAFSTIVVVPFGVATVVSAFVFSQIFSPVGGYANSFLVGFGLNPVNWAGTSVTQLGIVVFSDYWKNTPLVALILFSGLSGLSPSMFDAATVDGAGPMRRFLHITLPNMAPIMSIALLIRGVSEFNIFALPLVLIGYHPPLINTLVYEFYTTTSGTIYYSYAAATILLVIIMVYAMFVLWRGGAKNYAL